MYHNLAIATVPLASPRLERVLGYAFRTDGFDSEFRADFIVRVPAGQLPTTIRYDYDGNGDFNHTAIPVAGPGVDQQFQVVEVEHHGADDLVAITMRGDGAMDSVQCPEKDFNLRAEVNVPAGSFQFPLPVETWSFGVCSGTGRPVARLPWDNAWGSPDGNSQDGFGVITNTGQVPANKFLIDADNPNPDTDCGITTQAFYQFVHEDGSPSALTPAPVAVAVTDHHNTGFNEIELPAVDFAAAGDSPGYYKFLVWPEATSSTPGQDCSARTWNPSVLSDGWQVGSVFYSFTPTAGVPLANVAVLGGAAGIAGLVALMVVGRRRKATPADA